MKRLEVAAAVLRNAQGEFLLAQRPAGKVYAGWWEVPGGKVEPGESVAAALARELHEELGIDATEIDPWLTRDFTYPHAAVRLRFCQVRAWTGELHGREGQAYAWQRPGAVTVDPVLPANGPILRALELPAVDPLLAKRLALVLHQMNVMRDHHDSIAADDPDQPQGRPSAKDVPEPPKAEPWQALPLTDEQLRNPVSVLPPSQRPRVVLRYGDARDLLVSGLLEGGSDIAQHAAVIDVPLDKGHVVLFSPNPIWRGETQGSYFLVFNATLNFDHLDAGRTLDK